MSSEWLNLLDQLLNVHKLKTDVWQDWYHTFITRYNKAQHCRLDWSQGSDFAGALEDSKTISGGMLCIFRSWTSCSNLLDVQEANICISKFHRFAFYFITYRITNGLCTCSAFRGWDDRNETFIEQRQCANRYQTEEHSRNSSKVKPKGQRCSAVFTFESCYWGRTFVSRWAFRYTFLKTTKQSLKWSSKEEVR